MEWIIYPNKVSSTVISQPETACKNLCGLVNFPINTLNADNIH